MADSQQSQLALVSQCAGQDLAVQVLSVTCHAHPCAMHGGGLHRLVSNSQSAMQKTPTPDLPPEDENHLPLF